MAQTLTVAAPGLDHLAIELVEQVSIPGDKTGVEETTRGGPRAADVGGAFGKGPHAWLDADTLFPQGVAHGFGYPRQRELACMDKDQLRVAPWRQLPTTVCAERDDGDRA